MIYFKIRKKYCHKFSFAKPEKPTFLINTNVKYNIINLNGENQKLSKNKACMIIFKHFFTRLARKECVFEKST